MITIEHIKQFIRYNGNPELWLRGARRTEEEAKALGDWGLIDSLVQDLKIVKSGLASSEYADKLQKRLIEHCENEQVITQLKSLAGY